jgi:hypothetical protein
MKSIFRYYLQEQDNPEREVTKKEYLLWAPRNVSSSKSHHGPFTDARNDISGRLEWDGYVHPDGTIQRKKDV